MRPIALLSIILAFFLAGCQTTMNSTGETQSYTNCAEAPSRLEMTNYYGTKCRSQFTKKVGLEAVDYYMQVHSSPYTLEGSYAEDEAYDITFRHGKAGNLTMYNFTSAETQTRRYRLYNRAGGYIKPLPKYQNDDLTFEVVAWRSAANWYCRTYYAGKGLAHMNSGLENMFLLYACSKKNKPDRWFEGYVDAIHVDYLFDGTPVKGASYDPTTSKSTLTLVGIPKKDRLAFTLNWPGSGEALIGQMGPIGPRKQGRTYLLDKAKGLECEGKWGHRGAANQAPKVGFWNLACTNGKKLDGLFKSDKPGQGTITGRELDGPRVNGSFAPE